MANPTMQVIGLCRFSYPAIGGFQVEHDSPETRSAYLYDPARLEERFRTFEAFTLPPLRAQTDSDFTFLVVIGEDLPAPWRDRLEALLADIPQAVLQAYPPAPHRPMMKTAINAVRHKSRAPCLQFRMDDDDAVSVRFVQRLREVAEDSRSAMQEVNHIAIDFTNGWVARPDAQGIAACAVSERLWTPALAMSARPKAKNTIMNFSHMRMGRFMPVLAIDDPDMFIRGHNAHNDSRQKENIRQFPLAPLDHATETLFQEAFNIEVAEVRRIYTAP